MSWIDFRSNYPLEYPRTDFSPFPTHAIFTLTALETDLLEKAALKIESNPYLKDQQEAFIAASRELALLISSSTRNSIQHELDFGFGAIVVNGLPVDRNLPSTPLTGGSLPSNYKKTFVAESMLILLGTLTGSEPFNFRQEGRGTAPLIDNIVPIEKLKTQKGAGGFDNKFPFHCESAWHRKRPDYLTLLGIREASDANTLIFSAQQLEEFPLPSNFQELSESFRLKSPQLYSQMQEEGIPMGTAPFSCLAPVEIAEDGRYRLNINFNGTECLTREAAEWLSQVEEFIEQHTVGTIVSPGNAVVMNNQVTCHTRTSFSPSFMGMDRWFIRGYFKKNLWHQSQTLEAKDPVIQELIDVGWMDSKFNLTPEFQTFVDSPLQVKNLTGRKLSLVSHAFNFTPVAGSRIV